MASYEWPPIGGGGSGVTTINGATGPAITIAAGTGISIGTLGNTITVTNTVTDTGITQLTGDVTAGPGSGSQVATVVRAPAGTLTGTTLNATVVSSSLTSVGTITTGVWHGTTIAIANGGSGQVTANAALNAFLPSQATHSGQFLQTDGTNTSWATATTSPGGTNTDVQFNDSGVFGGNAGFTYNKTLNALALDPAPISIGTNAFSQGSGNQASGLNSTSLGESTVASGEGAHSQGSLTQAQGDHSHSEGESTNVGVTGIASGQAAHSEGIDTIALGDGSHAEGTGTQANGRNSHAEGDSCVANSANSHAEGDSCHANGLRSHAEGESTVAGGVDGHSEGRQTSASGAQSHAQGRSTLASNSQAHAEGMSSQANGAQAHAEGMSSQANGDQSHASGLGTIANSDQQTVVGLYNIAVGTPTSPASTDEIFTVGNGTGVGTENTAFAILRDASLKVNNSVGTSGQVLTSGGAGATTSWTTITDTGITQLTGDATAGPGSGSQALTLATVNGNVGTFGTATQVSTFTVNAKGLITAASNTLISIPFSQVTGTVPINQGGTGQTTKTTAFDALSPMTTGGDIIYGGASGTGTRLPNGTTGQVLTSNGGTSAPSWQASAASPAQSEVWVYNGNGFGSTNTVIRRFSTTGTNVGTDITYADSATLGATFTINTTGRYAMDYTDATTDNGSQYGISLNSSQLTTAFPNISDTDKVSAMGQPQLALAANMPTSCSATMTLNSGDVIRAHTNAGGTYTSDFRCKFRIARIG